jgi:hypothetical protein
MIITLPSDKSSILKTLSQAVSSNTELPYYINTTSPLCWYDRTSDHARIDCPKGDLLFSLKELLSQRTQIESFQFTEPNRSIVN